MAQTMLLIVLCFLFFTGCSLYRVDSKDTSSDFYAPKDSVDQVVFLEKLKKPYDVIGVVKGVTEGLTSRDDVIEKMRYEAAILGADAVTDLAFENEPFRAQYTAKAVVFK